MSMKRKHYISLLLMLLLCAKATAQDITIAEFKELPHDLTARTTTMIDNAGEAGAVIRFLVRDMNIVIEPNLGVLKREERQGEIDLWVPKGTKRITIRRKGMIPLSGYVIPVRIESKVTYEARVEMTQKVKQTNLQGYLGTAFSILPAVGPSASVGLVYRHHVLEVGGTFGLSKTDQLYFYNSKGDAVATYSYQPLFVHAKYGYEWYATKMLSVTPFVGAVYGQFKGKTDASFAYANSDYQKASAVSASASVRMALGLGKHLSFHVTPEYRFCLSKDNNSTWIAEYDKTLNAWTEGLGLNVGMMIRF